MFKYQQENIPSSATDVEKTKQLLAVAHFSSCDYPFYSVIGCIFLRKISASQFKKIPLNALSVSVKPPAENSSNSESFRCTSFISSFSFQQQTESSPKVMQFSDIM